jgi:toxin ParE1/3/4
VVVRRILAVTYQVEKFVKIGRRIPEFRHPNYRQLWVAPCWIYYRQGGERVYILHVRRAERPLRFEDHSPTLER